MIYLRKKLLLLNEIKEFVRKNTGKMLRELGLDLDRRGSVKCDDVAFLEPLSRHRNIVNMESMSPALPNSVYVAPNATVFGNVFIANDSYVGFGAVINGLYNPVRVGSNTKIGDHTTLMAASYVPDEALLVSLNVGNNVNIEMNCSLFGPVVDDNVHIGFGSVIMQGAQLQRGCVIAPNSCVPAGSRIPQNTLWAGNPVEFVRNLQPEECKKIPTQEVFKITE